MDGLVEALSEEINTQTVFTIPLFGGIPVFESVAVTWIITLVFMLLILLLVRDFRVKQISGRQAALESIVGFAYDSFESIMGKEGNGFVPYLTAVFLYIAASDMAGIFGFKSPTKDMNVTVTLALMSIVLVQLACMRARGLKGWAHSFAEPAVMMAPLNVLELIIKPLSLCMRLFGNVLGATVIMAIIEHFAPVLVPIPFSFYFDVFDGIIQAYVFVFLTSLYLKEAIETA